MPEVSPGGTLRCSPNSLWFADSQNVVKLPKEPGEGWRRDFLFEFLFIFLKGNIFVCLNIQRYRKVYSEKSPPVPALECPFPNSEAACATQFLGNHRDCPGLYKQMYRGYIFQSLRPVLALCPTLLS